MAEQYSRHEAMLTPLRAIVEQGGGVFIGLQQTENPGDPLVLFHSPVYRSTLALKLSRLDSEAVREKVVALEAKIREGRPNEVLRYP